MSWLKIDFLKLRWVIGNRLNNFRLIVGKVVVHL